MSNPLVDEWRALMAAHKGDAILSDYNVLDMLNLGTKMADELDFAEKLVLRIGALVPKIEFLLDASHQRGDMCACGDKPSMCYKCAYTIVDKALAAQREQKEIKP